jgi:transketolase
MRHDSPTPDTFILSNVPLLKDSSDICILSYGPIMKMAIGVAEELEAKGRSVAVASVHTLKPLNVDGLSALLSRFNTVVVEEHSIRVGLGSQVKELAWDRRLDCIIHMFGLRDEFMHIFGSQTDLWQANGLSVENITRKILVD